ncbi:MAG: SMI1/KNR4 family protein [Verrucomicrobiota bacterium]
MGYKSQIAIADQDIARLEAEFSIKLPKEYIHTMQNYPSVVFEYEKKASGLGDEDDYSYGNLMLCADPEALISLNKLLRDRPERKVPWPNEFFVIGEYGHDYLFIDVREKQPKVYIYSEHEELEDYGADEDHDMYEYIEVAEESLKDLVAEVIKESS